MYQSIAQRPWTEAIAVYLVALFFRLWRCFSRPGNGAMYLAYNHWWFLCMSHSFTGRIYTHTVTEENEQSTSSSERKYSSAQVVAIVLPVLSLAVAIVVISVVGVWLVMQWRKRYLKLLECEIVPLYSRQHELTVEWCVLLYGWYWSLHVLYIENELYSWAVALTPL